MESNHKLTNIEINSSVIASFRRKRGNLNFPNQQLIAENFLSEKEGLFQPFVEYIKEYQIHNSHPITFLFKMGDKLLLSFHISCQAKSKACPPES